MKAIQANEAARSALCFIRETAAEALPGKRYEILHAADIREEKYVTPLLLRLDDQFLDELTAVHLGRPHNTIEKTEKRLRSQIFAYIKCDYLLRYDEPEKYALRVMKRLSGEDIVLITECGSLGAKVAIEKGRLKLQGKA